MLILSGVVEIRSSANWLDGFREKLIASLLRYLLLAESLGTSPQLSQGKKRRRRESETETQSSTEARNDASSDDNEDDDTPGMTIVLYFIEDHPRLSIISQ